MTTKISDVKFYYILSLGNNYFDLSVFRVKPIVAQVVFLKLP